MRLHPASWTRPSSASAPQPTSHRSPLHRHAPRHRARRRRPVALLAAVATALTGSSLGLATQPLAPLAAADTPGSVTLVGDLQSEAGCTADWQPDCAATAMTDPDGDGVYTLTTAVGAGSWQLKVALNGTWDVSYGKDGTQNGDNIPLTLAGDADLTFTYDATSHRIGLTTTDLAGAYDAATDGADPARVAPPVRQGTGESFYFVLTDRFADGDPTNNDGGLTGDRLTTGYDPTDKAFYHGGDIAGIIDQLDYIQSLGTTAVWLTPSFTNQPVQGEGADASAGYHGYWITDFTQVDPHLGGNDALAELRDALHERGMRLYLDIIVNHTADLIDYQQGTYDYVDTATSPYKDAAGNPVDITALAGSSDFPTLDATTSFPYTPVRTGTVVPDALNDVTLYHNRGNSTWTGESVTMGDFSGLDDLMTENPVVEQTFEDVYTSWMDFGVDGFRIDTAKHVNFQFWKDWTSAVDDHAAATNPDFFTFGEVYDADAAKTSPYVRDTGMDATLDFAFQAGALNFAKSYTTQGLSSLFASDDYYTTAHSSVYAEPTFLGNHDMGRVGYLLGSGSGSAETLARDELAHSLMYLTRGQPVVYYGDEQGFAGSGDGTDKNARQDMFPTQVDEVAGQQLVDGTTFGASSHYDTSSALYQHIAGLARLRTDHPALADGAQIELHATSGAGVYALARVDATEKLEHLVALNNATTAQTATFTTLTPGATYTPLYSSDGAPTGAAGTTVTADDAGSVTLTVPALGAVVLVADRTVADTSSTGGPTLTLDIPDGAGLTGSTAEVSATVTQDRWAQTTFSYRPLGSADWTTIGTAEDDTPRVFADLSSLADGTALELRAVTTDASGARAADSALVVVGENLTGAATGSGEDPVTGDTVTVPGTHNAVMGCPGDWQPGCAAAALTRDPESGLYTGTFDLPAGTYEYKVAVGGTWDENYGAGGEAGGANITYTTDGGKVTFLYDPTTHRVWNDAEDPIITLPGSMQAALGCTQGSNGGNWAPACLATAMVPGGDGTWTYATSDLPGGTYEVKVAHNLSWDENYGVDGVAGGANYSFAVETGKLVTFTYTMSTHVLDVTVEDPPVAGTGEQRAYWVDATTLAWPVSLLPVGTGREDVVDDAGNPVAGSNLSLSLVTAPVGGAGVADGAVVTGPGGREIPLRVTGDLPDDVLAAHPNLAGYVALSLTDADGTALLDDAAVRTALTGQLAVVQRLTPTGAGSGDASGDATGQTGAAPSGTVDAFTGVQTALVLDSLYAGAARQADLGVTFSGGNPGFALWAPTATSVTLLSWDTGSAVGSAAQVDGDAVRTPALHGDDGRWTVANTDGAVTAGSQYLWEVEVYVPSTGRVERNLVTDPYSVALTTDSTRSVAVDLADPALAPEQWATAAAPTVDNDAARTIYELHVRDFSAADATVPADLRGTYEAFTVAGSDGMTHLAQLADAGVNTIHLLPTFDIATIPEDRSAQVTAAVPDAGPASTEQQAAVASTAATDAYNWGYDPYHWMSPEGSYATDGNQDGGARTVQFRDMVGALHATGLQVVLDEVYNHTSASGQDATSVLDKVVPGYYHRLDAVGRVTTSTCCSNVATENAMSEQLMIDSVVWWAKEYKVDGFRFDLMGHHSVDTMKAVRAALDELTVSDDGVDGSAVYLYGEGWNFGEVADNALFTQATQGQLDGTGIGTFNDRLRDAVHGGSPFDSDHRSYQGFGSGEVTDPNGYDDRSQADQETDLAHRTDLVRLSLAGNLKDYTFTTADGTVRSGSEVDYNGQPAGYASSPEETVNYVDAHDNETLYDLLAYKLPVGTPMSDRIRMNTLSLATVTLSQSPSFWAAGTEILRSKSLDRDSYDSGDHFNAIDWSMQTNGFANGLPVGSKNGDAWPVMTPLLENPGLVPSAADIATSNAQALDLLRLRSSTPLFSLGSTELVQAKLSFPGSGPDATPGVITMLIDDTAGGATDASASGASASGVSVSGASAQDAVSARSAVYTADSASVRSAADGVTDVDPALDGVLVVFNASAGTTTQTVPALAGRDFTLSSVQADGSDAVVKETTFDAATGTVTVPARTVAVLTEAQGAEVAPTDAPTSTATGGATGQPGGAATDGVTDAATGGAESATASAPGSGAGSSSGLAVTGVEQVLGVLVLALLAAGGALLRARRRSLRLDR